MKTAIKVVLGFVLLVGIALAGTLFWAKSTVAAKLEQTHTTHSVEFPTPFPLTEAELAALRAERATQAPSVDAGAPEQGEGAVDPLEGVDLGALATERAIERGKHLVGARYVCVECHGQDFGGGVMVEDDAIGTLYGPNLTSGKGSKVLSYRIEDWDRIVRHGVNFHAVTGRKRHRFGDGDLCLKPFQQGDLRVFIQEEPFA